MVDLSSDLDDFLQSLPDGVLETSELPQNKRNNKDYCRRYREKKRKKEAEVSIALQTVSDELSTLKLEHARDLETSFALQNLVEFHTSVADSFRYVMNSVSEAVSSKMEQAETIWAELMESIQYRMLFPSDNQLRIIARIQQHFVPPKFHTGYVTFVVENLCKWEVETPQGRARIERLLGNTIEARHRFLEILPEEKIIANPKLFSVHPCTAKIARDSGCLQLPQLREVSNMSDEQREAIAGHYETYHKEYAELQRHIAEGYKLLEESLDDANNGIGSSFFCLAQRSAKAEKANAMLEEFSHKVMQARLKLGYNIRQEITVMQFTYNFVKAISLMTMDIVKSCELILPSKKDTIDDGLGSSEGENSGLDSTE